MASGYKRLYETVLNSDGWEGGYKHSLPGGDGLPWCSVRATLSGLYSRQSLCYSLIIVVAWSDKMTINIYVELI